MYDYYRVRFSTILPPRRPIYTSAQPSAILPRPRSLVAIETLCFLAAWTGLLAVMTGPRAPIEAFMALLGLCILTLPLTLPLALGLSADQRWTRPFMVCCLAGIASLVIVSAGAGSAAGLASAGLASAAAIALYRAPSLRAYYASIPFRWIGGISFADLHTSAFAPLWGLTLGAILGASVGHGIVSLGDAHIWTAATDQIGFAFIVIGSIWLGAAMGQAVGHGVERLIDRHAA